MTGLEEVKIIYCILKFGGFPIVALLYGFNFQQYENFFDRHIVDVIMLTFGTGVVLADSLHEFSNTVTIQSSIYAIMYGIFLVAVKAVLGVVFSAIATWFIRIISPFFVKHSEPLKRWLKKTFK